MNGLAQKHQEKLNWRTSIVVLMKLLNLDSSLSARKTLAQELQYPGDMNDSASMNMWLHKQVMKKLAENRGKVPDDLKNRNGVRYFMKHLITIIAVLIVAVPAAFAYQVTGPVLEVTDSKIIVEKDKEKWELARDKNTKVTGQLKKGAKVTVQYEMTATRIEVKDAPAKK